MWDFSHFQIHGDKIGEWGSRGVIGDQSSETEHDVNFRPLRPETARNKLPHFQTRWQKEEMKVK